MVSSALLFDWPAPVSSALTFGAVLLPPPVDITLNATLPALTARLTLVPARVDLTLNATLPALSAALRAHSVQTLQLNATLAALAMSAQLSYVSNTPRPIVAQVSDAAQITQPIEGSITQPQSIAQATNTDAQAVFGNATPCSLGSTGSFNNAQPSPSTITAAAQDATPMRHATAGAAQDAERQWLRFYSPFQQADRAYGRVFARFEDGIKTPSSSTRHRFADATRRPSLRYTGHGAPALARASERQVRFQQAQVPPPGMYVAPVVLIPTLYIPADLLFQCPPLTYPALVFGVLPCVLVSGAPFYILPARFYMTAHTVTAKRLTDNAEIPIYDATVAADAGSYCWSLSATGPVDLFAMLAPVNGLPVQVQVTLDGLPFVFAVDSLSRTQRFGQSGVSVSGRSVTALIGAPYMRSESRIQTLERTAQQLALEDLDGTGITLDWGIGAGVDANGGLTDWLVPTYSRNGTPLEAVSRIAAAAGGYLQSHRSTPTLLTRHPYGMRVGDVSGAPWDWMTGSADVELAPDALITMSTERKDGPDLNAVYVSGTNAGVLALVKRTGSAADKLAAMVTDSLITHTDAARQKGLAILGAAGHKYHIVLELPVLTGANQPGILDVGQLVQVNESTPWRGRVRAVSVAARRPSFRQSVTLERHMETA